MRRALEYAHALPGAVVAQHAEDASLVAAERARQRARSAEVTREPAGVDPGDARHTVAAQEVVQALRGAPVAGAARQIADHDAGAERPPTLDVLGVHAVVPDVRAREGDHLPGVRRVGEDLLVTRERGVEHDLARRGTRFGNVADGLALEGRPVGQDEERVPAHRCAMPSTTTGSPRSTVWRTRPVSLRPA